MVKNKGQNIAYMRVSTNKQKTDRQLADLDIEFDEIFEDKVSGKNADRPGLNECIRHCRKGDTLYVHSIDRLARDLSDLQQLVKEFTDKGVTVVFHKNNLSFSGGKNATDDLLLQLLGAVAEFERKLINERISEGMMARKAKGLRVGAKPKFTKKIENEIRNRVAKGEEKKALAKEYGVSRTTIYRILSTT